MSLNRRTFMKDLSMTGALFMTGAEALSPSTVKANVQEPLHIACNQYTLACYYRRDNKDFMKCLAEIKKAGVDGVEGTLGTPEEVESYVARLKEHGLEMRSMYLSGNLHDESVAEKEFDRMYRTGAKAGVLGTKILSINLAPKEGKSDKELLYQGVQLDRLGREFRKLGLTLSYHYHVTEMAFAAREFTHMMTCTTPETLTLCFDLHWTYRASGHCEVAVFDCIKNYGKRVSEFHLRQSQNKIWTEVFQVKGDIDYVRAINAFKAWGMKPHIVLEQAPENGTPKTMSAAEILTQSVINTRQLFA